jgi:hypothetical protein
MKRPTNGRGSNFGSRFKRGRPPHVRAKGLIRERYDICPDCGQAVDLHEASELSHHEKQGHGPLRVD